MSEVLFYAAHQTRWYTDNIKMWLAEIEGHSSSEEDEARRQNLRDEIRAFFELILEYIMRATGHINKAALAKAAKAVVQPDSWWKQGLDKLKDRRASLEEHLKLSAEQKEKRRKRISAQTKLISTFKPDPAVDMPGALHLHSHRAPHTCRWFRKHPTFDKWWRGGGGGADHLLVSADPGSGKTTLSAYLVQKVLPKYCPKAIVIYYFFDYASTSRQELAPALSSLLYQLFRAKRELADDHEDAIEGDETSATGLGGILAKVTNHASCPPVICVLDALDECTKEGRRTLAQLANKLPSTSKLRFLMTTRSFPEIVGQFAGPRWRHVSAEEAQAKAEIQREIEVALDLKLKMLLQERGFGPKAQAALAEAIREKGRHQTTYLWLKLLFLSLEAPECDYRPSALKTLVNGSLQGGIDTAYATFLQGVVAPEVQGALRIVFHLLVAASRPLRVREVELALRANARWDAGRLEGDGEADALELLQGEGGADDDPQRGFQRWLRDSCQLFLTVHGGRVRFLHLTAQEFLLQQCGAAGKGQGAPWYAVDPREAERVMVESCLPYLSLRQFSTDAFAWQVHQCIYQQLMTFPTAEAMFSRQYGFLAYALQYWPGHFLNLQGERGSSQATPPALSRDLLKCYVELFGSRTPSGSVVTPPWLLLCQLLQGWESGPESFGFTSAAGLGILHDGDAIELERETYGGAVARWDHHTMLKHFVPPSAMTKPDPHVPLSPRAAADCGRLLHMAVRGSAFGCLAYLLSSPHVKSFINERDAAGETPLAKAAMNFGIFSSRPVRNVEMLAILLDHGADKTATNHAGLLPFCHFVRGIQHDWPFFVNFEDHKQKGFYTAMARRLMLNKTSTQWKQLPASDRASYDKSLELFLAMCRKPESRT